MKNNNPKYPETIPIKDFLDQRGIRYYEEGAELKTICLFANCDEGKENPKNGHLYFSTKDSTFYCHKCSKEGNIYTLADFLGIHRNKIIINSEVDPFDLISDLVDTLKHDELFQLIVELDRQVADWDFTERMYKYYKDQHKLYRNEVRQ